MPLEKKRAVITWFREKDDTIAGHIITNLISMHNDGAAELVRRVNTIEELRKENENLRKKNKELEGSITETAGLIMDTFIEDRIMPQLRQLSDDYTNLRQRHMETVRENSVLRIEVDTYRNGRFAAPGA